MSHIASFDFIANFPKRKVLFEVAFHREICIRFFIFPSLISRKSVPPFQKQPLADVLQSRCSKKLGYIHRKTPVLESLFDKVLVLQACNFIKN